ncbi:MAG: helix-turn-helix transcriptional regulator [Rikenellaceae bacterium]
MAFFVIFAIRVKLICRYMANLNRIKEVLKSEGRTAKWLCEKIGKDAATMSRWCNNRTQPSIETLDKIATVLDVNRQELLHKSK